MSQSCRSCSAPIVWAITATGKRMPLDAEPSEKGTLVLLPDGRALGYRSDEAPTGAPRHVSHFATCKFAAQHRKPR